MPLDFQLTQAPLRFGLSEDIDPHQVPFGTLLAAENCRWVKSGRLQKRFGLTQLTTDIAGGGSLSAAARLVTRGSELALITGDKIYGLGFGGWNDHGRVPEAGLEWETSQAGLSSTKTSDVAAVPDGKMIEAWVTGDTAVVVGNGTLMYQVRDVLSGVVITPPTVLEANTVSPRFRVLASSQGWVILWQSSGGTLKCQTMGGTTTLRVDSASTATLAMDAYVQGNDFVVAYTLEGGGIRLARYTMASTPALQANATVTGETSTSISALGVSGASGETLYVSYSDVANNRIRFAAANPSTMAQTVAPVNVETTTGIGQARIGVARESSTTCLVLYSFLGTGVIQGTALRTVSINNAGTVTTGQSVYGMEATSKPFLMGTRFYAFVHNLGNITSDTFLVDVTFAASAAPFRQLGKTDCLIGGRWTQGYVANPSAITGTKWITHTPFVSEPILGNIASDQLGSQGTRLVTITTGADRPQDMWRSVSIGQEAYLSGGLYAGYDGSEVVGYGWGCGPIIELANTTTSGAGGSMLAGTYLYNVTAERRSAVGVFHRSPVGTTRTIGPLSGTTSRVTLAILASYLGHSQYSPGIFVFYRSIANGNIVQRLSFPPSYMTILESSLTSYPVTKIDDRPDASIGPNSNQPLASRPPLYTESGELEDTQPPAALTTTVHQNRLWTVAGDGLTVWFSKSISDNPSYAPGFSPDLTLRFEEPVGALASMDEKLLAFGEDRVCVVIGQGPNKLGEGGSYEIMSVQGDVGCTNARSVVSVPDGVMFQSAKGIHLMTRSLEVVWIGRPIQDQLALYPKITSAVLVPSMNEVRFTANAADGLSGQVLVYNYIEKQWSTSKYTVNGVYAAPIADAIMWQGVWTFVTPAGIVSTEDTTKYLDGSTWVPLTIETAWNNAGAPLAFQSVRRFAVEGIANSHHDLTLSVGFNTESSYTQSRTFLAGSSVTNLGPFESLEISIGTRRKCQAIRFKIQDATPTNPGSFPVGTGQGPSFDMLGIEVGMKKGFAKKPAGNTG